MTCIFMCCLFCSYFEKKKTPKFEMLIILIHDKIYNSAMQKGQKTENTLHVINIFQKTKISKNV